MAETTTQQTTPEGQQSQNAQQTKAQQAAPAFDYDKLASIIAGNQSVAEDTTLKGYFKQQGLSKEEVEQAISAFKQQKAENTPDAAALQAQATQAQQMVKQMQIEQATTLEAVKLGIPAETIPYVLKMADFAEVTGTDGKVDAAKVKEELDKVLKAVPGLKPQTQAQTGFQIGAPGNNQQTGSNESSLAAIFGNKK